MPASALILAAPTEAARPWPRHVLTPEGWRALVAALEREPGLSLQGRASPAEFVRAFAGSHAFVA